MAELVARGRHRLQTAGRESPGRECRLLLGHLLGWTETQVIARDDRRVPPETIERFDALLSRREGGEPVAYLLGRREFYGRDFLVDPRVLVPRPETEHLVEAALGLDLPPDARVLDVGVGSGAIAVTLALERPGWRVAATDRSADALAVARANARRLGGHVTLLGADLTAPLRLGRLDLVVSNPPYLAPAEAGGISPEVREFEPASALFAPGEGLGLIERLLTEARSLQPGSPVILEIGHRQLAAVEALAERGPWRRERVIADYQGIPRVLILSRRGGESTHHG